MSPSEQALLDQWVARRDAEAFAEIVSRYSGMVYSTCCRILGNDADAQDITQECFLHLARGDQHIESSLGGWLHTLATSRSLNLIRSESRRRKREAQHTEQANVATEADWSDFAGCVDEAIQELPPDLRELVIQHFLRGEKQESIARELGVTPSAISQRIRKGVEMVRKHLRHQGYPIAGAALASMLTANTLQAIPATLTVELGKLAIAGTSAALYGSASSATSSLFTPWQIGGLIMGAKVKIAAVVICIAALGWFVLPQFHKPNNPTPLALNLAQQNSSDTVSAKNTIIETSNSSEAAAQLKTANAMKQQESGRSLNTMPMQPIKVAAATASTIAAASIETATNTYYPRQPSATESVLSGFVFEQESEVPIPGALIQMGKAKTRTDEMGIYRVYASPGVRCRVEISAEGYVPTLANANLKPSAEMQRNFHLEPGCEVAVSVSDEEGEPISEASVNVHSTIYREGSKTDIEGQAILTQVSRLKPRSISAGKKGYEYKAKQPRFAPGEKSTTLSFVLARTQVYGIAEGTVTDASGNPLSDIQVGWIQSNMVSSNAMGDTSTQSNGSYRLEINKRSGSYWLMASGKGWAFQAVEDVVLPSDGSPMKVDFVLQKEHKLEGVVVNARNRPLRGLSITVGTPRQVMELRRGVKKTRTKKDGRFVFNQLSSSELMLIVHGKDQLPLHWETYKVDQHIRIVIPDRGIIKGQVLDESTQKPISDFTLTRDSYLTKAFGGTRPTYHDSDETMISADDGCFVLKQLHPTADHSLRIKADGYASSSVKGIKAVPEDKAEVTTILLSRSGKLVCRLVDAKTGAPLVDVPVVYGLLAMGFFDWAHLNSNLGINEAQRVMTGMDGSFELTKGANQVSVFVKTQGYERLIVIPQDRVRYLQEEELRIPLSPGASVAGIYMRRGLPVAAKRVLLIRERQDGRDFPELFEPIRTDEGEQYRWNDLSSGLYSLHLSSKTSSEPGPMYSLMKRVFRLRPEEYKTINLGDELGQFMLTGKVIDASGAAVPLAVISLKPSFQWDYVELGTHTNAQGQYVLEGLKEGKYSIEIKAHPRPLLNTSIEIQGDTERDFTMQVEKK
jgi:RNA polymerase sigma factor (sigma-70 family)